MNISPDEIEKYLSLLSDTSRRLMKATQGFDDARLQYKPDEKIWSVKDILAHLRSCADVWEQVSKPCSLKINQPCLIATLANG